MDYFKIYTSLINRGRDRAKYPGIFYEKHHIVPRCMGGSNDRSNMTLLTLKEHYIAHRLLVKMYPSIKGLYTALWNMCNVKPSLVQYERYKPSARIYERLRGEYMSNCSGENAPSYGKSPSKETRDKLSAYNKGRKRLTPSKLLGVKLSPERVAAMKGKKLKPETISKMLESRKGFRHSAETRKKMSDIATGKDSPGHYKAILQFSRMGEFIKEWDAIKFAAEYIELPASGIYQSCIGKAIHCGGYIWRYKDSYKGEVIKCIRANQKQVYQYTSNRELVSTYNSTAEAARALGIRAGTISESIRNNWKAFGFYFSQKELN